MTVDWQPLTNTAYGYPRGATRRLTPYILAVVHQTSNTATAQQERNYANRAGSGGPSATYYIDRDGSVIGAVDGDRYASWSSGDLNAPDTSLATVARIVAERGTYNANEAVWDQYECCGTGPEPWTDAQFEAVARLIAARAATSGLAIDRTTVLAHRDINGIDRATDPWPADRREDRLARLIGLAHTYAAPGGSMAGPNITALGSWSGSVVVNGGVSAIRADGQFVPLAAGATYSGLLVGEIDYAGVTGQIIGINPGDTLHYVLTREVAAIPDPPAIGTNTITLGPGLYEVR